MNTTTTGMKAVIVGAVNRNVPTIPGLVVIVIDSTAFYRVDGYEVRKEDVLKRIQSLTTSDHLTLVCTKKLDPQVQRAVDSITQRFAGVRCGLAKMVAGRIELAWGQKF